MRTAFFAMLLGATLAVSCDPVNTITVRFPVEPSSTAIVYWVHRYEDRSYAQGVVWKGAVDTPELQVSSHECCGTAAAYRARKLWFIACVERPGAAPELVCGRPGDPPDRLVRAASPSGCQALRAEISSADVEIATCTLTLKPRALPPAP